MASIAAHRLVYDVNAVLGFQRSVREFIANKANASDEGRGAANAGPRLRSAATPVAELFCVVMLHFLLKIKSGT
ncbi:hypothetical protein [Neobacillus niacini]|uniref:hypothetical protein n=1 Tax=Neobacillus niacini TaxID=86668 RepID=UPI00398360B3